MANRATITYNGNTISTEDREGNFAVSYNGRTLATITPGVTKTLKCSGKYMLTNVVVGGKTLVCTAKQMLADVIVSVESLFPSTPSAYSLIGTYNSSGTFTAPENGYFQIELQGASGTGAKKYQKNNSYGGNMFGGSGGGGGGCAISRVKLNKGDTVNYTLGTTKTTIVTSTSVTSVGNSSATINSSIEQYDSMSVTGAQNGRTYNSSSDGLKGPTGGTGGVGSGGNYANYTGGRGGQGGDATSNSEIERGTARGGSGGSAGYSGGNKGGEGEGWIEWEHQDGSVGANAFIKIYRGNTNVV